MAPKITKNSLNKDQRLVQHKNINKIKSKIKLKIKVENKVKKLHKNLSLFQAKTNKKLKT